MILVDTSVWIDHFRTKITALSAIASAGEVLSHRYVEGELAMGNTPSLLLQLLRDSEPAAVASHDEVMLLIMRAALAGTGIGYVDAHLLAATLLTPGALLWTRDRRLRVVADRLGLAADIA